jgi:pilus assembly protein CpaE
MDIAAATNAGTPIVAERPDHPASRAYGRLASAVMGEPVASPQATAEQAETRTRSRGLFRRGRR